jgi:hypothetical protein
VCSSDLLINQNVPNNGVRNITDRYLNEIKTEHILAVWEEAKKSILKTFDFFENHLHIKTPYLIPFRYFYFTITAYFYKNPNPDYEFLKKYFWFNSFHNDDLLSNTTQLFEHIEFLNNEKLKQTYQFDRFLIDKQKLRLATYSSKGRMSRAILSLYSNAQPKDWDHCGREVQVQNFFFTTDKPNLHHIFPTNSEYVLNSKHKNRITSDSLMNIAYLTQITNLDITNRNPLEYIKDYDKPDFEAILQSHLLSKEILEWARSGQMPQDGLDHFFESRVNKILTDLKIKLSGITFDELDTMEVIESDKEKAIYIPSTSNPESPQSESMAAYMDSICKSGGTWIELAKSCAHEGELRGVITNFTPSVLRAHVNYRIKNDPKFLGSLKITENGIEIV